MLILTTFHLDSYSASVTEGLVRRLGAGGRAQAALLMYESRSAGPASR